MQAVKVSFIFVEKSDIMKNLSTLFFSFILLFGATNVFSQETESRMGNGGPYWILGVNGGAAWQDSDVKALPGGGWSLLSGT